MRPPAVGSSMRDVVRTSITNTMNNLSYVDMNMARDGSVMTRDQIRDARLRQGYCTECRGRPVQLYTIKKAKYNPLYSTKKACSLEGQSLDGQCLLCHPELDPNRRQRRRNHRPGGSRRRTIAETSPSAVAAAAAVAPSNSSPRASPANGLAAGGRGGRRGGGAVQSMMNLNATSPTLRSRPLASSLTTGSDNGTPTNNMTSRAPPTRGRPSADVGDRSVSPPRPPQRSSPAPPLSNPTPDMSHPIDAMLAGVSIPDLDTVVDTVVGGASTDAVAFDAESTSHDSAADNMLMDRSSSAYDRDDTEDDVAVEDDDNIEIIYARCRRMSSMRNLRQNSMVNLVAPPADASPTLTNLFRSANSPLRNDNSRGASSGRQMPQSSSRNLNASSSRNLNVPPLDRPPPGSSDSDPISSEEEVTAPAVVSPPQSEAASSPASRGDEGVVLELGSLIKDLSSQGNGNADFTTDILVGAMKNYPNSIPVQLFCLGTIWDLCKDSDQYKSSIISTSAPDDILLSMKSHLDNPEIQERACGALWSLSVNQHNRVIVIRAGAPARIVKAIVDHQLDENVIRTAVGCLRTLSPESEVRESMGALQGMKYVCEAMSAHRTVACIQRDGCAFLSNSAVDLDKQQVAVASDYEFEAIVKAMESHRSDASVMAGATFALKNYTYEERNVRSLCNVDGIDSLLENSSQYSQDANCRRDASIVLERIQNCKEEDSALENHVVTSLVELMTGFDSEPSTMQSVLDAMMDYDWSATVSAGAFQCLANLANLSAQHRRLITDRVLHAVIARMAKMIGSIPVQVNGCEVLKIMAKNEESSRPIMIERGCKAIIDASKKHPQDVSIQVAATGVLKELSTAFECWFELQKVGGDPIGDILAAHPDSSVVQQNASEIQANFSAYQS